MQATLSEADIKQLGVRLEINGQRVSAIDHVKNKLALSKKEVESLSQQLEKANRNLQSERERHLATEQKEQTDNQNKRDALDELFGHRIDLMLAQYDELSQHLAKLDETNAKLLTERDEAVGKAKALRHQLALSEADLQKTKTDLQKVEGENYRMQIVEVNHRQAEIESAAKTDSKVKANRRRIRAYYAEN
jgi:chromosome segregation ATPase